MAKRKRRMSLNKTSTSKLTQAKFKTLECVGCGNLVKVDIDTIMVRCGICNAKIGGPAIKQAPKPTGRPRGWQFMAEFVDSDGNVYHRGEEQPKLKGKRPVTDVESIKKEQSKKQKENKKKKAEREEKRQARLVVQYEKKKAALKKAKEKKEKEQAKLEREIKGDANSGNKTDSTRTTKSTKKKSKKKRQSPVKSKKKTGTTTKSRLAMFTNVSSERSKDELTDSEIKRFCKMYDDNNYRLTEEILVKFKISRYVAKKILTEQGYYE